MMECVDCDGVGKVVVRNNNQATKEEAHREVNELHLPRKTIKVVECKTCNGTGKVGK